MRTPILEKLASGAVLLADGATGTMLQALRLAQDDAVGLPGEAWILERPAAILALHRAYLDVGSQLILTATFGGTRVRLQRAGLEGSVAEINRRAAELAREAAGDDVYVGGDIGPTGEMMAPLGSLTYEQAVEAFAEQAEALAAGGADCICVETMSALDEGRAAVEGARRATDLPIFCTFSFDTRGRTSMGVTPARAAEAVASLGAAAVGANCGHAPEDVLEILPQIRQAAPGVFLVAKPNAGIPRLVKRQVVYDAGPERMAELARQYVALGASVVGACCGSSPEHIAAMRRALAGG